MPFVKDEIAIERRGVLQFLQTIQNHSPLVMDAFVARLQAGADVASVGRDLGQSLFEIWQQTGDLERKLRSERTELQSCQRSLELYRREPLRERVILLQEQITGMESENQNREKQQRSLEIRLNYLERENEQLKALAAELQAIIADQQLQLARLDLLEI
jgi:chromosome segregation ATPase